MKYFNPDRGNTNLINKLIGKVWKKHKKEENIYVEKINK